MLPVRLAGCSYLLRDTFAVVASATAGTVKKGSTEKFSIRENLYYGHFFRDAFKSRYTELADIFYQLDARYAMRYMAYSIIS